MKKNILLFILAIGVISCHPSKVDNRTEENDGLAISGDTVTIRAGSNISNKIQVLTIRPRPVEIPYTTAATVKALPECIAEVAVPFEGRIVESFIKAGQRVKVGDPLFSIHSPAFFETVKSYLQARQEKQVAELNLHRQQDLVDHGVGVRKELDEAQLQYEIAKWQVDNLLATLSIYNVKPEDTEVGRPLVVTSPINGEIVRNTIRIGQYFTTDSDPLVTVADLKKVWVVAQVKENRVGLVSNQDEVTITLDAYPGRTLTGHVFYTGKILDEETRALEVIIECDNPDQILKPGMFATATFRQSREEGMVVPSTAIIQGEDQTYVYKSAGPGRFIRTRVDVASDGEDHSILMSGVVPGDEIVSEGAIYFH